ncbi:MAG TPA: TMEM165/GDT1 family protein [Caldilineae bacterium]|nr:TMEM165/GDT1 family protein [Caldilineae bacterium]
MNWDPLLSSFGLVFVAELGDKTQLAVLTQTCKYRRPLPVFLGASVALTAVTALSVVSGHVLNRLLPQEFIRAAAALAFLVMGGLIWWEAAKSKADEPEIESQCEAFSQEASRGLSAWNWRAFGTTLALLFLAELGDKTQLAVVGMSCRESAMGLVFAGSVLALISITLIAVVGGRRLSQLIPERLLLRLSAAAFVIMGGLIGLNIL